MKKSTTAAKMVITKCQPYQYVDKNDGACRCVFEATMIKNPKGKCVCRDSAKSGLNCTLKICEKDGTLYCGGSSQKPPSSRYYQCQRDEPIPPCVCDAAENVGRKAPDVINAEEESADYGSNYDYQAPSLRICADGFAPKNTETYDSQDSGDASAYNTTLLISVSCSIGLLLMLVVAVALLIFKYQKRRLRNLHRERARHSLRRNEGGFRHPVRFGSSQDDLNFAELPPPPSYDDVIGGRSNLSPATTHVPAHTPPPSYDDVATVRHQPKDNV